jgi:hypothetical protein
MQLIYLLIGLDQSQPISEFREKVVDSLFSGRVVKKEKLVWGRQTVQKCRDAENSAVCPEFITHHSIRH